MSVSRVGGSAQEAAMKSVAGRLKLELSQYEEVARFARFGTEVNEATQRQIERGMRLQKLLEQGPHTPVSMVDQVILFYALTHDYMDIIPIQEIPEFSKELLRFIEMHEPQLIDSLKYHRKIDEKMAVVMKKIIERFIVHWNDQKRGAE